jgi:hypothetical protein
MITNPPPFTEFLQAGDKVIVIASIDSGIDE